MLGLASCSDDSDSLGSLGDNGSNATDRQYFNVVVGINVEESTGATYSGAFTDLSSPATTISFAKWGFEVPSVRTARVYASDNGCYLYNLSYGGGTISKYLVHGGQEYSQVGHLDISLAMETSNPRWTKLNDQYASLHNVTTANQQDQDKNYAYTKSTIILTAIDLQNFEIVGAGTDTGGAKFEMPRSAEDIENNLHVWRIDAPAIVGGKAYYGLNKRIYDTSTSENVTTSDYNSSTLVVDFPGFTNPKIITSSLAKGSTQGYRTPVAHADEKGNIYQSTAAPSKILKISNEDYDNSYDFDLSSALGMTNVGTNGWFYVGDGIGYLPFYDAEKGTGSDVAAWGVARIDLYNKKAVKLNLPENLWLQQYQYGVLGEDGKFYMAIAPLGGDGYI